MEKENCILISSGKNWMEQAAKDQLLAVSRLPGVVKAVGFRTCIPGGFLWEPLSSAGEYYIPIYLEMISAAV